MANLTDNEDEDMQDAPQDVATPREDSQDIKDEADDDEVDQDNDDEEGTPARDSISRSGTPRRSGRGISLLPRKRRLGRPPKNKPHSDDEEQKSGSDVATPVRRGRGGFRGHRGGRWGKPRGGPSHVSQAPKDQEGNELEVLNDEVVLPEDADGERKIDKLGYLQEGREYRVRTFTIFGRGKRLYMLSTEPARCIGFRDSYLFFQKHKLLYKIIIDDDEKRDLIERDLIPHSYKGRAIGVVTARSVFREFGAKIIIGGKKIIDDYQVQKLRAAGEVEGELAAPDDVIPPPGQAYNRNQYVAWHGASSVYHTGNPTVPLPGGKMVDGKKRKIAVTSDNWMLEHAREASRFNSVLASIRKETLPGVYDIHTNTMQYPSIVQPTHARWERADIETDLKAITNGMNGHSIGSKELTILPKLEAVYARNFRIHDLCLESAPDSSLGLPGLDADPTSLTNVPRDVLDELPADCRAAFDEARRREIDWKSKWLTEATDGLRAKFTPSMNWTG